MTEPHIERAAPLSDEAPSPTESVKDEGQNYRLLVVANRLPITIKKHGVATHFKPIHPDFQAHGKADG